MKVATCQFCEERVEYMHDPERLDKLGRWMHVANGKRKCCDGTKDALPQPGTVKRTVEDVQVTGDRV